MTLKVLANDKLWFSNYDAKINIYPSGLIGRRARRKPRKVRFKPMNTTF